jgi:hypothetical protein
MFITHLKKILTAAAAAAVLLVSCSMDRPGGMGISSGTDISSLNDGSRGLQENRFTAMEDIYPVVPLDVAFTSSAYEEFIQDFLSRRSGSTEIAAIIMDETRRNSLPISLTFSLAWAESRFNPFAVNWNENSIDRGLFQLNNRSFPALEETQFFDPVLNARNGVAYLKYCLERGENEVTALAMYNAGPRRVSEEGAPRMTLDYIHKIMSYRQELEDDFQAELRSMLVERTTAKSGKKVSLIVDRKGSYQ